MNFLRHTKFNESNKFLKKKNEKKKRNFECLGPIEKIIFINPFTFILGLHFCTFCIILSSIYI